MPMTARWTEAALLAILLAGCASPTSPIVMTTTSSGSASDAWFSAEEPKELAGSRVVAVRFDTDALGVLMLTDSQLNARLGWLQPSFDWTVSEPSNLVGSAYDAFAQYVGGEVQVVLNFSPPSGGVGWTSWVTLEDGKWTWEENPVRWSRCVASGITAWLNETYALLSCPTGWSLFRLSDSQWTSESLPGVVPTGAIGRFAITSNATHLFVVGQTAQGAVALLSRTTREGPFNREVLQEGTSLGSITAYASAPPQGPPVLAWWHNALPLGMGPEPVRTYAATRDNGSGSWAIREVGSGMHAPVGTAADETGFFLAIQDLQANGQGQTWRFDGRAWTPCDWETPADLIWQETVTGTTGARTVYTVRRTVYSAALDAQAASCLEGDLKALPGNEPRA